MSVTLHHSPLEGEPLPQADPFVESLLYLRGASEGAGRTVIDAEDQDEEEHEEHRVLLCRACSHTITSEKRSIEMNGSHRHTFFNPAGIVFELGCFSEASGVAMFGETSSDFSWFAGYVWRVAVCARCGNHLGWQFSGARTFYGLILKNLAQG